MQTADLLIEISADDMTLAGEASFLVAKEFQFVSLQTTVGISNQQTEMLKVFQQTLEVVSKHKKVIFCIYHRHSFLIIRSPGQDWTLMFQKGKRKLY